MLRPGLFRNIDKKIRK